MNLFNLSKSNQEFVLGLNNSALGRSLPVGIAIARVVSSTLNLPGERVENIKVFYVNSFASKVYDTLYRLNEMFSIDVEGVAEMVKSFYESRYKACYQDEYCLMGNPNYLIASFFNLTESLSNQILNEIVTNSNKIMYYHNGVSSVLKESSTTA